MDFRQMFTTELEGMGVFRSPCLGPAFHAVDREMFAPTKFWALTPDAAGLHPVVDKTADEDAWRQAVWALTGR